MKMNGKLIMTNENVDKNCRSLSGVIKCIATTQSRWCCCQQRTAQQGPAGEPLLAVKHIAHPSQPLTLPHNLCLSSPAFLTSTRRVTATDLGGTVVVALPSANLVLWLRIQLPPHNEHRHPHHTAQ